MSGGIDPIILAIINSKIRDLETSSAGGLTSTVVSSLPTVGENNKIYIITQEVEGEVVSTMHMYIEDAWYQVGTSKMDSKDWLHVYNVDTVSDFYNIFKKNALEAPVYFDAAGPVTALITNGQVANTVRSSGMIDKASDGRFILDFTSGNGAKKYTVTANIDATNGTFTVIKMNCFRPIDITYNSSTETISINTDYTGN